MPDELANNLDQEIQRARQRVDEVKHEVKHSMFDKEKMVLLTAELHTLTVRLEELQTSQKKLTKS
jgi:hypothetical protein